MTRSGDELTQPAAGDAALLTEHWAHGNRIGRYRVRERLGQGGMGVVFAAWDPELDREVAIKVLYPSRARMHQRREALRREAQALAQLNHPNVVTILHVGEDDGQIYVVMERVRGVTLDVWWKEPRETKEILQVLLQAGRGLAAAHAVGLVHRDFKPANIMVSPDEGAPGSPGRVRVMDFGLARTASLLPTDGSAMAPDTSNDERGSDVIGTPAYMAPEQFEDAPPDPRSDQFAFCATAYEALAGRRPYGGESIGELALSFERRRAPPLARAGLAARSARAIERGLASDPALRWPSLEPLLVELAGEDRSRRRWIAASAVAALGCAGALWLGSAPAPDVCARTVDRIAAWPADRERIRGTYAASERVYAAEIAEAAATRLDAWIARWQAQDQRLCRSAIAGTAVASDAQRACLDAALGRWGALVDVLARGDDAAIDRALPAIATLPAIERCEDVAWLEHGRWGELDEAAAAIQSELDLAGAEFDTADYAAARARLAQLRERVTVSGDEHWSAAIDLVDGDIDRMNGQAERAAELFERAHFAALASGDEVSAFSAALLLIETHAEVGRFDEARRWAEHSESLARRIGDPHQDAQLDYYEAGLANRTGEFERAIELAASGLSRIAMTDAPETLRADLHNVMGIALARTDRFAEATEHFKLAWESDLRLFGENHPDTTFSGHNYATILAEQHRFAEAIPQYERMLRLRETAFGPTSPRVADVLANMAAAAVEMGDDVTAERHARRAVEIFAAELGPHHATTLVARAPLGVALLHLGRVDEAREQLEAVLQGEELIAGDDDRVVDALLFLARLDLLQRSPDDAVRRLERASQIHRELDRPPPSLGLRLGSVRALAFAEAGRCAKAVRALADITGAPAPTKETCADLTAARSRCPTLTLPSGCT